MTVSSRLLASFRTGHKVIGGVFRLAVYGKILQGEAELLEQHDRERCVSLGSFYRLADGIAKDTGMPIEEVDKLIQDLANGAPSAVLNRSPLTYLPTFCVALNLKRSLTVSRVSVGTCSESSFGLTTDHHSTSQEH